MDSFLKHMERRPSLVVWAREFAEHDRTIEGFHTQINGKLAELRTAIRELKGKEPATPTVVQFNDAFIHQFQREKRQLETLRRLFRRHFGIVK
ncbi:hypothetical protein HY994_03230 [Candidatus Micrarchaeota archaeon]|nr:hypothetical protein [Candidatus Micrarchaeota archaeon]